MPRQNLSLREICPGDRVVFADDDFSAYNVEMVELYLSPSGNPAVRSCKIDRGDAANKWQFLDAAFAEGEVAEVRGMKLVEYDLLAPPDVDELEEGDTLSVDGTPYVLRTKATPHVLTLYPNKSMRHTIMARFDFVEIGKPGRMTWLQWGSVAEEQCGWFEGAVLSPAKVFPTRER